MRRHLPRIDPGGQRPSSSADAKLSGFLSAWAGGVYRHNPWIDDTPKPALWPPSWLFPAAWAGINYPSLGFASWLIWRRRTTAPVTGQLALFGLQLALNGSFLPLVYHVKSRRLYVGMDAVAAALTTATALSYGRAGRLPAPVLLPYLGWTYYTTLIKALLGSGSGIGRRLARG